MARTKQASTRSIGKPSESRNSSPECHICRLTSRRSQPPLALAVPLSRFTPRVGGGSAFYVRRHYVFAWPFTSHTDTERWTATHRFHLCRHCFESWMTDQRIQSMVRLLSATSPSG